MSGHALLSASGAERWELCPISVTGRDDDSSGRAAAEGTLAHKISEDVLSGKPWPAIGSKHNVEGHDFVIDQAFLTDANAYVQYVATRPWTQGGYTVENRVNYANALQVPHNYAWGTSDCIGMQYDNEGWLLEVIDLKFGRALVSPDRNPQGLLYAQGAISMHDATMPLPDTMRVRITIFQPRLRRAPYSWDTTVGEVRRLVALMRPAAGAAVRMSRGEATAEDNFQFPETPGDHCKYCRRKKECASFRKHMIVAGTQKTIHFDTTLYAMRSAIRSYLEQMEEDALREAVQGRPPVGTKLVAGKKANPQLRVPIESVYATAQQAGIGDKVRKQGFIDSTPAAIRDAFLARGFTKEQVAQFISQEEGKPILVDATDPRAPLNVGAGSGFTGVAR